jgi:hypothetical protein
MTKPQRCFVDFKFMNWELMILGSEEEGFDVEVCCHKKEKLVVKHSVIQAKTNTTPRHYSIVLYLYIGEAGIYDDHRPIDHRL